MAASPGLGPGEALRESIDPMTAVVSTTDITKTFSGVPALRGVSFDIERGEVHALLGENGAGKSTLMKILSGAYQPTSGTITIDGVVRSGLTPAESSAAGISIIYQELSVIDQLSIAENIFVGRLLTARHAGLSVVDWRAMRRRTRDLLAQAGLAIDPDTTVSALSVSEKQMVEILKAVAFDARVIVMDEPTSSLTEGETVHLFEMIHRVREQGTSIVYISHKLAEVIEVADRVTVLKDGVAVRTDDIEDVTIDSLVASMVGRELRSTYLSEKELRRGTDTVLLDVAHVTRRDRKVQDVSFQLHRGEILGFSGLVGAGRSELVTAIYGAEPLRSGRISLRGVPVHIRSPHDAITAGICLVTEDRRRTGIFHNFSIRRNISLGAQAKRSRLGGLWGLIDSRAEAAEARRQEEQLRIKCRDIEQSIVELSGGNQQKVLLGRWMAADPAVIIFDEPTKGIDVGTKAEIYALLRALADRGVGVIVVSSELPEILAVSDRVLVFAEGRITAEYTAAEASEEELVRSATVTTGPEGVLQ